MIARLPVYAMNGKIPRVDVQSFLKFETKHGVTMDAMYEEDIPEWI